MKIAITVVFMSIIIFVLCFDLYKINNQQETIDQLSTQVKDLEAQNSGLMDSLSVVSSERNDAQDKAKEFLQEAISCYREMDMNEKGLEE